MTAATTQGRKQAASRARTQAIRADAEKIGFARTIATAFTWLLVSLGWVAGAFWFVIRYGVVAVWFAVRYCAVAVRYGYRQGAHIPAVKPDQEPRSSP